MKKRISSVLAIVMVMTILLSACGGGGGTSTATPAPVENPGTNAPSTEAPAPPADGVSSSKDTLTIAIPTDPGSMDRHYTASYNWVSVYVVDNLMSQEYTADGAIQAVCNDESLATDVKVDEDGMGITYTLREGVLFHNGSPFTANDVVFSIKLCSDLSQFDMVDFENVEALDEYTVYVPLSRVDANAVYNVGKMVPIYCESYYDELGDEAEFFSTSVVSTGPYKVGEWVSGDYLKCTANEDYYAGKPLIENLVIRFISDASVAFMELESGGIDMMNTPNWIDTQSVINGDVPGITYWASSAALALQFGFNTSGALGDLKVRQAIAYAIDKETIALGAFQGSEENLYGIVPLAFPGAIDYTDNWPYEYNPERAKELLAEAGYAEGELTITAIAGIGSPQRLAALELMGGYLEAVGVTLVINSIDIATYAATIENNPEDWDIWTRNFGASMGAAPSPHDFFSSTLTNVCHLGDTPEAQRMYELAIEMGAAMDETERSEIFAELQDHYLNECLYTLAVTEAVYYTLMTDSLKNASQVGQDEVSIAFAYFE